MGTEPNGGTGPLCGRDVWPALWLLGDDIDEISWPGCGEIDSGICRATASFAKQSGYSGARPQSVGSVREKEV